MKAECPICYRELHAEEGNRGICQRCEDVMEFGYPSFAAYRLPESEPMRPLQERIIQPQGVKQLVSVR
jgi:hypothetical protein